MPHESFFLYKKYDLLVICIKSVLLVLAGSLCYTIQSKYSIVIGRLLAGFGTGIEGAIMGMMARSVAPKEKSKIITQLLIIKQFGVFLGPLLVSLFLGKISDYCISESDDDGNCLFSINHLNSSGYFQIVLSILLVIINGNDEK